MYTYFCHMSRQLFRFGKDKKVGCWRRWHSLLQKSQPKLFGLWWDSKCISRSTFYHSLHECRGILCLIAFDGKLGWARLTESLKMSQLVFLSFAVFFFSPRRGFPVVLRVCLQSWVPEWQDCINKHSDPFNLPCYIVGNTK
jgi:hypothetical protein